MDGLNEAQTIEALQNEVNQTYQGTLTGSPYEERGSKSQCMKREFLKNIKNKGFLKNQDFNKSLHTVSDLENRKKNEDYKKNPLKGYQACAKMMNADSSV